MMYDYFSEYDNEEVDEQVCRAVTCQLFAALCEEQNHLFKFIAKLNHITQVFFLSYILQFTFKRNVILRFNI